MAEETQLELNAPPESPPVPPPAEAVDENGVPYKNRVAEWERKAREADERAQELQRKNLEYQIELGRRSAPAPQPAPAPTDDLGALEAQFDAPTRRYIELKAAAIAEQIAERKGYEFITNAQVTNEINSDPELLQEARQQFAALQNNPMWAGVNERLREQHAVAVAKAAIKERRLAEATKKNADAANFDANRALAGQASLPPTRGGAPPDTANEHDKFIKEFVSNPENIATFQRMDRRFNPNTPEGKKRLLDTAETAWEGRGGAFWGGKTKVAIQAIKEGLI